MSAARFLQRLWRRCLPFPVRDAIYRTRRAVSNGPARVWRMIGRTLSRFGRLPLECSLCRGQAARFVPLAVVESELAKEFAAQGLPWPRSDRFETLNVEDYACPWCGATDRERLLALHLQDRLSHGAKEPWRLLDIAPAAALQRFLRKQPRVLYRSADLLREDVDDRVDIQQMPGYADHSFDIVICSHVLEHVPDDRRALAELARILAPGGTALLLVPIDLDRDAVDEDPTVDDAAERLRRFGQRDHVRMYSRAGFLERLQETGLALHRYGAMELGAARFRRHALRPTSTLYVLEKGRALPTCGSGRGVPT